MIGGIHRFVGQLPIKNMVEIEAFKEAFDQKNDGGYTTANSWGEPKPGFKKRSQSQRVASGLQICAPLDQFEHTGAQRQGRYLVDDPIVLQPVVGGYLIVSAWGTEAEDPLVKDSDRGMISISDLGPNGQDEQHSDLRVNGRVVVTFTHKHSDGLVVCLERAAAAVRELEKFKEYAAP